MRTLATLPNCSLACHLLAAVVLAFLLAACQAPAPPAPTPIPTPTPDATEAAAHAQIAAALTGTPTPAGLSAQELAATWVAETQTAQPTPDAMQTQQAVAELAAAIVAATLAAQPTDTPTWTPSPTPSPTATPNLAATRRAELAISRATDEARARATDEARARATGAARATADARVLTTIIADSTVQARVAAEVLIPAGPFQMGCAPADDLCGDDERPLHEVTLDAYFIDTYEVTNARYAACVDAGACTPPYDTASGTREDYFTNPAFADFPVVNVDWFQAEAFCTWEGKRLPTEAEWEKAARGSDDTRIFPWGDGAPTCDLLNFYDESRDEACVGDTTAVGSYPAGASPYGVMDLSGNVWEWTNDWYDGGYYSASPAANPHGPDAGESRVLRGGSWDFFTKYVRASLRYGVNPVGWDNRVGFRCVRSQ